MMKLDVIGNLGADAEVKDFNGNKFVTFRVANTDRWTDENGTTHEETTWISCTYNGDGGKLLQYLRAGKPVFVTGSPQPHLYSSPKLRQMVAGLNLRVNRIELLPASNDEVPRELYDDNGAIFRTNKCFFITQEDTKRAKVPYNGHIALKDKRSNRYQIDHNGFIIPIKEQQPASEPQNDSQSEDQIY